jgi:hypothetical protein
MSVDCSVTRTNSPPLRERSRPTTSAEVASLSFRASAISRGWTTTMCGTSRIAPSSGGPNVSSHQVRSRWVSRSIRRNAIASASPFLPAPQTPQKFVLGTALSRAKAAVRSSSSLSSTTQTMIAGALYARAA